MSKIIYCCAYICREKECMNEHRNTYLPISSVFMTLQTLIQNIILGLERRRKNYLIEQSTTIAKRCKVSERIRECFKHVFLVMIFSLVVEPSSLERGRNICIIQSRFYYCMNILSYHFPQSRDAVITLNTTETRQPMAPLPQNTISIRTNDSVPYSPYESNM